MSLETETTTGTSVKQSVPFFMVSNMEESVRYYIDGLGFKMINKWMDEGKLRWCGLQLGGAGLMLQEFRKEGHDSWVPEGKVGVGVSISLHLRRRPGDLPQSHLTGDSGQEPLRGERDVGLRLVGRRWLQTLLRESHRGVGGHGVFGSRGMTVAEGSGQSILRQYFPCCS